MRNILALSALVLVGSCVEPRSDDAPSDVLATALGDAWEPGSDIPGWEDYDCPELGASGAEIVVEWPDSTGFTVGFYETAVGRPSGIWSTFGLCLDADCTEIDPNYDVYLRWDLRAAENPDRGQGWYHATYPPPYAAYFHHSIVRLRSDETSKNPVPVRASMCLSRVRPDHVRGSVYLYRPEAGFFQDPYYGAHHLSFGFDVLIPVGGALSPGGRRDCTSPREVDRYNQRYFYYDAMYPDTTAQYDRAWPWDEITDPTVREALYDAYYPCGWSP